MNYINKIAHMLLIKIIMESMHKQITTIKANCNSEELCEKCCKLVTVVVFIKLGQIINIRFPCLFI